MERKLKYFSEPQLDKKEADIAKSATSAARLAFERALSSGGEVTFVRKGKIISLTSGGKKKMIGRVAPRVRKKQTVYRLQWTPQSPD